MSTADRRALRAGFTLIELMIAVVLAGIFATVVFQLFRGQSRFTAMQSSREEVDQNTRGAMELISSELRAVPSGGIVTATATKLQFQLPRVWGITCGPATAGTSSLSVVFPGAAVPADFDAAAQSLALAAATEPWGVAFQTGTDQDVFTSSSVSAGANDLSTCVNALGISAVTNIGADNAKVPAARTLTLRTPSVAAPVVGGRAYLYQTVTYDVGTVSGATGTWLRRTVGVGSTAQAQALAGPLLTDSTGINPVEFIYGCGNGISSPTTIGVAALTPALLSAGTTVVNTVEVRLVMRSRDASKKQRQIEGDTLAVHLRNTGKACT